MLNKILDITEAWLCMELGEEVHHDNSFIWEKAESILLDEIEAIKRWFEYLQDNKILPEYLHIEIFTIPRLDTYKGDDMLFIYQEGTLWSGFSFARFTSFTNNWSRKGLIDFLHNLPLNLLQAEEKINIGEIDSNNYYNVQYPHVKTDSSTLDSWKEIDNNQNEDYQEEIAQEEKQYDFVEQLLEKIESRLNETIINVEECVQEAINLTASQKGSKKLVRLMLNVEEELTDFKEKLSTTSENEKESYEAE